MPRAVARRASGRPISVPLAGGPTALADRTRRRGVGSALMDGAESYCADRGLRLVLDVADHNEGAITFYERRGWRRVGTTSLLLGDDRTTLPLVVFVLG